MIDVAGVINWKTFSGLKQCSPESVRRRKRRRETDDESARGSASLARSEQDS